MTESKVFDNTKYRDNQVDAFLKRINNGAPTVIEFGGKPFGDYHAARVLPGYDPDVKAGIIRDVHEELSTNSSGGSVITIAVHAKDLLAPPDGRRPATRIRGDYGIGYDEELLRMTHEARDKFGIAIGNVAITCLPQNISERNEDYLGIYQERLGREFDVVRLLPEIDGYPYIPQDRIVADLTQADSISTAQQSQIVVSPGGGSGKFSTAVTELAHMMQRGETPGYIKFETFPVFRLPIDHPLNLAFIASTADLCNELVKLECGDTNYDKDVGNFELLKGLAAAFEPDRSRLLRSFSSPTDMGVNVIETGILHEGGVAEACRNEIRRRLERYNQEVSSGLENPDTTARVSQLVAADS